MAADSRHLPHLSPGDERSGGARQWRAPHQRQHGSVSDGQNAQEGLREQVGFQAASVDRQPLEESFGRQASAVKPELLQQGIRDELTVRSSATVACQLQEGR